VVLLGQELDERVVPVASGYLLARNNASDAERCA
jgi:hypothetical protein